MLRVLAIGAVAAAAAFPQVIQLPRGFQPEGIEIGNGTTFYVGSLVNGASAPLRIRRNRSSPPHRVELALGRRLSSRHACATGPIWFSAREPRTNRQPWGTIPAASTSP